MRIPIFRCFFGVLVPSHSIITPFFAMAMASTAFFRQGRHHAVRLHFRLRHPGHRAQRACADAAARRDAAGAAGCGALYRAAL